MKDLRGVEGIRFQTDRRTDGKANGKTEGQGAFLISPPPMSGDKNMYKATSILLYFQPNICRKFITK